MNMEDIQDVSDYLVQENSQTMDTSENCELTTDKKASYSETDRALTPPNSKIEIEPESMQLNSQIQTDDYVKLNDLKDIVEQILAHNIMENHINHFDEKMRVMEKLLEQFGERVEKLSVDLHNITRTMEPQLEVVPIRLLGGEANSFGNINDDDEPEDLESKSKQSEKQRNYSALFRKFNRQTKPNKSTLHSSTSKLSLPESQMMSQILDALHLKKKKPTTTVIEQGSDEFMRRAAERRQFETNILMYRKSQFSLRLNSRINKLAKKLWYSSEFLGKKPSKRQADKPSQTEETQSD